MAKKPKEVMNFEDLASANLGFALAQMAIDMLIKKGLVTSAEIKDLFLEMAKHYEAPGNPERYGVRSSAAAVLRKTVALKYDLPPKNQQN